VISHSYSRATHFSIVWGVALAIMTLVEWNSLERNPVTQEIISPFIQRNIDVSLANGVSPADQAEELVEAEDSADAILRYEVELKFNGPLFLACFFGPVLLFHATGLLWRRWRGPEPG
jgi:hypothetical protein